jgi:hypothetical protein
MRRLMRSGWRSAVLTALLFGCAAVLNTRPPYRVVSAKAIGPLLDVRLEWTSRGAVASSDAKRSLLFPNTEECRKLLKLESEVEYHPASLTGTVSRDEQICAAVGIASLREWRDRSARPARRRMGADRAPAKYRIVFAQADVAIVRGRFPLAGRVGWAGGEDTLALVPRTDGCRGVLEREISSMEYRDAGPIALLFVSEGGCEIGGFARVVPELRDR